MNLLDKIRYVEIHPIKIAVDILFGIVAFYLFWEHYLLTGIAAAYLPTILAAIIIMKYLDLEKYKNSKAGKYILKHKTLTADLSSIIGEIIIWIGAWHHSIYVLLVGLIVYLSSYCYGIFDKNKLD